ncbi:hypothetical protein ALC53_14207 [Atta colombica]|uniref:Uncharacterized protein n=1 Tax=Atta colombica TaxID=520822 RepID=A0A195ATJ3_9HYME|nr:hypothetical protein ALC53_14207 [Atta colombica]
MMTLGGAVTRGYGASNRKKSPPTGLSKFQCVRVCVTARHTHTSIRAIAHIHVHAARLAVNITILAQEITNPLEATMGSIIEKHHSEESSKLNVPWNRNTSSVLKKRTICDGGVLLCE